MKKNYLKARLLAAGVLFSLVTYDVSAQLMGNYTINSANATGGTNFQTFNDLEAALTASGVAGPVIVDVAPGSGPYNEQVLFTAITGASAANRITINGNDNLLTFNSSNSGQRYTIGFNGADYFTINDLQVEGTGTYAYTCLLYGGADFNMFSGCTFSVPANNTSSNQIPVVVSGSGTSYSTYSNSGSNNTWSECDMFSGYFGVTMFGPTSPPYNTGNKIMDCTVREFYYGGLYLYYHDKLTVKNNTLERPTRTNLYTYCYSMYVVVTTGTTIEGNKIHQLYTQNQTMTGYCYGILLQGNSSSAYSNDPSRVENNIITDINFNGYIYGFYLYYLNGPANHNTLAIDHPASTAGYVYGMMMYTTTNKPIFASNNLIVINKGGSGYKIGMYHGSTTLITSDNNNIWVNGAGSQYYAGYYSGYQQTLANLQSVSSQEANTYSIDPMFALNNVDVTPTNVLFDNLGDALGVVFDQTKAVRNQSTPDIGAIEFLSPTCSGTPTQTVVGPTWELCPGEIATFSIGGLSPDLGLTYQWQMSNLSAVGPFTLQGGAGATNINYTSPPNTTTMWYSAIITCTAPGGNSVQAVAQVSIAPTTTNSVPYYESFEGIGMPNRMPNCSWSIPGLGASAKTYVGAGTNNLLPRTGSSFAAFTNPGGMDYYYTNGIYMVPGVTYSASVWYQTDLTGANNWTDLSIMLGTSQSPAGLTTIATTGGPAVAIIYKSLSNTFTVASAGFYYVAVRATGSSGTAMNLSWDDLRIEIPCQLNTPAVSMSANKTTICAGESVILTATGADNYSWNNGAGTGSMVTVMPQYNTYYTVMGTHANSGCSANASQMIQVNPAPVVGVLSIPSTACEGAPLNLQAYGASSYNWSTNKTGPSIMVTPTGPTSYTVQGTNSFGCMTSYVHQVTPFAKPVITAVGPQGYTCKGDEAPASASGANSYIWKSNNVIVVGNPASLYPNTPTTYTVEGTDENGCTGETTLFVDVKDCTGLTEMGQASSVKVYPNPTSGAFTIEMNVTGSSLVQVTDVTGRVIFSQEVDTNRFDVNISAFAAGIYYVQVSNGEAVERIRVIRN